MEWLGLAGALMLLAAWIPQTVKAMKSKGRGEDALFLMLYSVGTFLLLLHSYYISDLPFMLLNGVILAFLIVHIMIKALRGRKG